MEPKRQQLLLGALVLVLAVAGYRAWVAWTDTSPGSAQASNETGRSARSGQKASQTMTAPDVHLQTLDNERPEPQGTERDLFRFKPMAPPPAPPRPTQPEVPRTPTQPPGPLPPAPITLKFLGFVTAPGGKIAVLSDGLGDPIRGREGETILGRYRILKIGEESIEIAYLDGRGRTTIRMTGS